MAVATTSEAKWKEQCRVAGGKARAHGHGPWFGVELGKAHGGIVPRLPEAGGGPGAAARHLSSRGRRRPRGMATHSPGW